MGHGMSTIFLLDQFRREDRKVYYTREEISLHNTPQSLWILCNGKVYDITQFYKSQKHPGGRASLLSRGGGIIDCGMDYKHHSKKTKQMWKNYLIGYLKK